MTSQMRFRSSRCVLLGICLALCLYQMVSAPWKEWPVFSFGNTCTCVTTPPSDQGSKTRNVEGNYLTFKSTPGLIKAYMQTSRLDPTEEKGDDVNLGIERISSNLPVATNANTVESYHDQKNETLNLYGTNETSVRISQPEPLRETLNVSDSVLNSNVITDVDFIRSEDAQTEQIKETAVVKRASPIAKSAPNTRIEQVNETRRTPLFSNLLSAAESIRATDRTLLMTLINHAYLPLAYNWLCNTIRLDIHQQVLIVTTDPIDAEKLKSDWPKIKVIAWPEINSNDDSDVGYIRLIVLRSEMLFFLIERNFEIFLFEVNSLWFKNPIPVFSQLEGYDLSVRYAAKGVVSGSMLYMFPTNRTKLVWSKWSENLCNLRRKPIFANNKLVGRDDNIVLSRFLRANAIVQMYPMDFHEFPDGRWYEINEDIRNRLRPYTISNNNIRDTNAKIQRAQRWRHWFLNTDNSCDYQALEQLHVLFEYAQV